LEVIDGRVVLIRVLNMAQMNRLDLSGLGRAPGLAVEQAVNLTGSFLSALAIIICFSRRVSFIELVNIFKNFRIIYLVFCCRIISMPFQTHAHCKCSRNLHGYVKRCNFVFRDHIAVSYIGIKEPLLS
jgi:hypothetical protein